MRERMVELVGKCYLSVMVGDDADGKTEIRSIESMVHVFRNKGGMISGDLLRYRDFNGMTPGETINTDNLLCIVNAHEVDEDTEHRRTLAEDRARAREAARKSIWSVGA